MVEHYLSLKEAASQLSRQLFPNNIKKRTGFISSLMNICARVQDKDFLLIHNPGGFGSTPLLDLLAWERSIVEGTSAAIERLGYSLVLMQHFRTGNSWWANMNDLKEQARFFFSGTYSKTRVLVAELRFVTEHFSNLKIMLIGASQGAAFSNAVVRQLGDLPRVYSIELGIFFAHKSRRVITEGTLVIDDNGVMPDPVSNRNLKAVSRAYLIAPLRWLKFWLQGKPLKFTYCLNAPGHDYDWAYFDVQQQIEEFIRYRFGGAEKQEVADNETGEIYRTGAGSAGDVPGAGSPVSP